MAGNYDWEQSIIEYGKKTGNPLGELVEELRSKRLERKKENERRYREYMARRKQQEALDEANMVLIETQMEQFKMLRFEKLMPQVICLTRKVKDREGEVVKSESETAQK